MRCGAVGGCLPVLVVAVAGCRASRPKTDPATPGGAKPPAQRTAASVPVAAPPPESPWFPPVDWSEQRAPEDFRIGVLDAGGAEPAARERLEAFFGALMHGRVDVDSVDPARRDGLSVRLAGQLQRAGSPTGYRIGRLEPGADGELRARVRFFVERGSVDGEAYLVRLSEAWLVSDLQVDLSGARSRAGGEPFRPSPYRDRTE